MGSSDGGGGNPGFLLQGGIPMPSLPVAGGNNAIGDPYQYGQFQNFLPDPVASGKNPAATGLTPDMFQYRKPNGTLVPDGGGGGGGGGDQISQLRDMLAQLQTSVKSLQPNQFGAAQQADPFLNTNAYQNNYYGGGA